MSQSAATGGLDEYRRNPVRIRLNGTSALPPRYRSFGLDMEPLGAIGLGRSVTNERKIWEAAILLVHRHGNEATDVAEREASRHHRRHDELTCTVWCWI